MKTNSDVKIAGSLTVADWESAKEKLVLQGDRNTWKRVCEEFFIKRLETRYFEPIKQLQDNGIKKGEGFSIVVLQCSLIEFLASTFEGKSYKYLAKNCNQHEYSNSRNLFVHFLYSKSPFNKYFGSEREVEDFYTNVRCALLHEARTKGGWIILAQSDNNLSIDVKQKVVYRDNLQSTFKKYVQWYRKKMPSCDKLQAAFIRKFDSLCEE